MALTRLAHQIIKQHLISLDKAKPLAIDATCGNGHDTVFLAQLGFEVIGFDIQETAIRNTQQRLEDHNLTARLVQDSHANMGQYVQQGIDLIVYNLGYLPHADKTITTLTSSTIEALTTSINILSKNGLISLMCYPGHDEGANELKAIRTWLTELPSNFDYQLHESATPADHAPVLYAIYSDGKRDT
jgi:methylase of polypeptide subunit release factors